MKKNLFDISITAKIAIITALIMFLNVGIMVLIAFFIQSSVAIGVSSRDLNDVVDRAANDIRIKDSTISYGEDFKFVNNNVYSLVLEKDGMVVAGRYPVNSCVEIGPPVEEFRKVSVTSGDYYVYDARIPGSSGKNPLWMRGVVSVANADSIAHFLFMLIKILAPVFVILTGITSYALAKKALLPVNDILSTVDAISDTGDLSRRINLKKGQDEIHRLSESFDNMFDRLENSVMREKHFTSNISHELRTPLSVINAQCDYLENYGENLEEYREGIDVIKKQTEKMSDIADTLLTLSRLEQIVANHPESHSSEQEIFDVQTVINESIKISQITYPNLKIDFSYQENNFDILGNKKLMLICFDNLFSNVHKYGENYCKIALTKTENKIIIAIRDNGPGIAAEDLPHIFDTFYRGNRKNRSTDGTGLGLSLVKRIVNAHGGNISIISDTTGTTVELQLPASL